MPGLPIFTADGRPVFTNDGKPSFCEEDCICVPPPPFCEPCCVELLGGEFSNDGTQLIYLLEGPRKIVIIDGVPTTIFEQPDIEVAIDMPESNSRLVCPEQELPVGIRFMVDGEPLEDYDSYEPYLIADGMWKVGGGAGANTFEGDNVANWTEPNNESGDYPFTTTIELKRCWAPYIAETLPKPFNHRWFAAYGNIVVSAKGYQNGLLIRAAVCDAEPCCTPAVDCEPCCAYLDHPLIDDPTLIGIGRAPSGECETNNEKIGEGFVYYASNVFANPEPDVPTDDPMSPQVVMEVVLTMPNQDTEYFNHARLVCNEDEVIVTVKVSITNAEAGYYEAYQGRICIEWEGDSWELAEEEEQVCFCPARNEACRIVPDENSTSGIIGTQFNLVVKCAAELSNLRVTLTDITDHTANHASLCVDVVIVQCAGPGYEECCPKDPIECDPCCLYMEEENGWEHVGDGLFRWSSDDCEPGNTVYAEVTLIGGQYDDKPGILCPGESFQVEICLDGEFTEVCVEADTDCSVFDSVTLDGLPANVCVEAGASHLIAASVHPFADVVPDGISITVDGYDLSIAFGVCSDSVNCVSECDAVNAWVTGLYNTAQESEIDEEEDCGVDPHWGALIPTPAVGWLDGGWISVNCDWPFPYEPAAPFDGTTTYSLTFEINCRANLENLVLTGVFAVDNFVRSVTVNGVDADISGGTFNAKTPFTIPGSLLQHGSNTIIWSVGSEVDTDKYPTGLLVEWNCVEVV